MTLGFHVAHGPGKPRPWYRAETAGVSWWCLVQEIEARGFRQRITFIIQWSRDEKSSGFIGRPEGILMRTGWPPLWFANAQKKNASTSGAAQRRLASDPLVLQRYVRCSSQAKRTKRFWQLIIAYDGHWHQTCGTFGDCVLKMRKLNELLLTCLPTLSYATPVDLVDTLHMSRHLWPW